MNQNGWLCSAMKILNPLFLVTILADFLIIILVLLVSSFMYNPFGLVSWSNPITKSSRLALIVIVICLLGTISLSSISFTISCVSNVLNSISLISKISFILFSMFIGLTSTFILLDLQLITYSFGIELS